MRGQRRESDEMFFFMSRGWGRDPRDHVKGYGYLYVFLGVLIFAALILFLPALILHSRTPEGAWHWTASCTVAEVIWWGLLLIIPAWVILAKANSPEIRARERAQLPWAPRVPHPRGPDLRRLYATRFLEPSDMPVRVHRTSHRVHFKD